MEDVIEMKDIKGIICTIYKDIIFVSVGIAEDKKSILRKCLNVFALS